MLVALYHATNGPNWKRNGNWLSDEPIGAWHGVTTDDSCHVTELNLARNRLSGAIPSQLGNLANLEYLFLYYNDLSGSIPTELGNLTNLQYLFLSGNRLSGAIPSQLGNLSNLRYLYLGKNQLSGSIPSQLGNLSNLAYLYLNNNRLSGVHSVTAGQPLHPVVSVSP